MKKFIFIYLLPLLILAGCTDAFQSKIGGYGDRFKIELVNCDGTVTHEWTSSGKVMSEGQSDGYYFMDEKTDKLIEVSGTIIITKL
jgi:hypothetical protein